MSGSNVVSITPELDSRPTKKSTRLLPGEDAFAVARERNEAKLKTNSLHSVAEIDELVSYFLDKGQFRDALFIVFGCNTGLRPGDILEYKWKHIIGMEDPSKVERKTGKVRSVVINEAVREAAELYRNSLGEDFNPEEFVFVSHSNRKSHVPVGCRDQRNEEGKVEAKVYSLNVQPLRERAVAAIIRGAAKDLKLTTPQRRICSYSLRKTALNAPLGFVEGYIPSRNLATMAQGMILAQGLGNHSNVHTTKNHYVEIQERLVDTAMSEMNFGLNAIRAYKAKKGVT